MAPGEPDALRTVPGLMGSQPESVGSDPGPCRSATSRLLGACRHPHPIAARTRVRMWHTVMSSPGMLAFAKPRKRSRRRPCQSFASAKPVTRWGATQTRRLMDGHTLLAARFKTRGWRRVLRQEPKRGSRSPHWRSPRRHSPGRCTSRSARRLPRQRPRTQPRSVARSRGSPRT
jgi:hypothetical protein